MSKSSEQSNSDTEASKRDNLAEKRTILARGRSLYAAERTFAAWIRTGFAIAGAGVSLATALRNSTTRQLSLIMGTILVVAGIFTFIYALYEYFQSYRFVRDIYNETEEPIQDFRINIVSAIILIVVLIVTAILGLILILF